MLRRPLDACHGSGTWWSLLGLCAEQSGRADNRGRDGALCRWPGAHDQARHTEYGEFKFDIGGHRWFTKNDELNDLFKEVVGDELLWVNRISRIYFDGKYVDYPLKISNALKAIGPVTAAKAMADYGKDRGRARRCNRRPIVSMEDAYIDQFGRTLYELFFPALFGESLGPALRSDEWRLGYATVQGHVAGYCRQGRDRSVEGQGRRPDRRLHVPA